jgi:hypothetical protein
VAKCQQGQAPTADVRSPLNFCAHHIVPAFLLCLPQSADGGTDLAGLIQDMQGGDGAGGGASAAAAPRFEKNDRVLVVEGERGGRAGYCSDDTEEGPWGLVELAAIAALDCRQAAPFGRLAF